MSKAKGKATTRTLGQCLIKSKRQQHHHGNKSTSERHSVLEDLDNVKSVTENTTVEEFLSTAEMSNKQFVSEKQDVKLVQSQAFQPVSVNLDENLESELLIPRRPQWDSSTTPEELHEMENQSYLKWRRKLAQLQERDDIVLTPFEKNLDFWRQLWRVVERSDVLVQILDARNPLMFFCEDLDKYIKEIDSNKLSVILLNKADYLTEQQRKEWLKYFHSIGKKCIFFSALQQQQKTDDTIDNENENENVIIDQMHSFHIDEELHNPLNFMQLISYFKSLRTQLPALEESSITVGLVGYPNVGKSSTINALLRCKRVSVSAMPGKTKHFQTIILDHELTICDCPGLVFPNIVSSKSEMIINGILPIDQMKDALSPIGAITSKIPYHVFESLYGIILPPAASTEANLNDNDEQHVTRYVSALELLSAYGYSKGFMTQRGLPDTSRAARYILKDFVTGKLLFCYAPPNVPQAEYHIYEGKKKSKQLNDQRLLRIYEANDLAQKNFDQEYFQSKSSSFHVKGANGISNHSRQFIQQGDNAFVGREEKFWRNKDNKRNKREKLRRVYAHLDQ